VSENESAPRLARLWLPTLDRFSLTARVQETLKRIFARPPLWLFVLLGAAALAVLVSIGVRVYSPTYGLTRLIVIGSEFNRRGIAVYQATPKYIDPYPPHRWGFDGQQYAQIALDPLLRDPRIKTAIDNPPYRARRILLPVLAWLGGLGRPFWILNVYATLNFVFWFGFAVMMTFLFRPHGWAGLAGFAAMLLTCGVIESMWASLTDFPGFNLMTLAVLAGGSGGAGVLALAALTRETSLFGLVGLWDFKPPWRETIRRNLRLSLIAAVPMGLWFAYLAWRLHMASPVDADNLDWPLRGIMGKLGEFSVVAVHGHIRWHRWYLELYKNPELHALLTIIALLTQCIYVVTHRVWENRFWRIGMLFVPFFLCIGAPAWESHFTVTRHALPITLAFNLLLAIRPGRAWVVWFLLGNSFVPYGIYQFYNYLGANRVSPPPPAEYQLVNPSSQTAAVAVRFDQGWSDLEWNGRQGWRWVTQPEANVLITNPAQQPLEAELSFVAHSVTPRSLEIKVRGIRVWAGSVAGAAVIVRTSRFLLPPGATRVNLRTAEPLTRPDLTDDRLVSFRLQNLQLRLIAPPAGGTTLP
jgi:hypothetical protein